MIDLLLLVLIFWCGLLGYAIGGMRTLIYASAAVGTLYMITIGSPWLRSVGFDPIITQGFYHWLDRMMEPIAPALLGKAATLATLTGGISKGRQIATYIYLQTYMTGYAAAVLFGLLLGLQSLQTLWPIPLERRSKRRVGFALGTAMGIFMAVFVLRIMGTMAWVLHVEAMRILLYRSVIAHAWTHATVHGIFN